MVTVTSSEPASWTPSSRAAALPAYHRPAVQVFSWWLIEPLLHLLFLDSAVPSFMVVAARPSFFTEQAVQQSSSSCTATLPCLLAVAVTFVVQWRALFCSSSAALVSSVGHLFGTGECSPLPLASSGSVMCCICCELSKFDGSSCCFVGYVNGEAC